MLAASKGILRGNTVVVEDDMRGYEGAEVIVTILNMPTSSVKENSEIDWDSFVSTSERGKHVEEYMREMRENDRL